MNDTHEKKLRIAYLCLQATTEGQASHAHVHEIIDGLVESGHNVDLYEPRYAGSSPPSAFGRLTEFFRVQRRLARRLHEYDVLYIRGHPLALPASHAAIRRGIPVVQECNGPYQDFVQAWPAAAPFARVLAAMARAQFHDAQAVIAVTPRLAEWVLADARQPSVFVVPNGANVELFSPDAARPSGLPEHYVVFFGSLTPWQGVDVMLEAASRPEWPEDVALVIVGEGRLREQVKAAVVENPKVVYLGVQPYRSLGGIVAHSLGSLVTKQVPSAPLKLYESMAAGVPVIASDFEDLTRLVLPIGAGVAVPRDDAEALAGAVGWIAHNRAEAQEMGRKGREAAVACHSWTARATQTAAVIEATLAAKMPPAPAKAAPKRH